ncbi:MAG TPA: amidohydrolase [Vicinamibacterales bacterium]|nr:amidohydrolase [Vicinamibacterales bacterium]
MRRTYAIVVFVIGTGALLLAQGRGGGAAAPPLNLPPDTERITQLKTEAAAEVEKLKDFSQQMVDQLFSYGELGFQEFETSKYLVNVLKQNGFSVEQGVAGIPTSFMATWGSGKPIIALGSDIDGIPQSSQKPGVAYREPMIEGAPGHGEGHNSGQAVNITAAIVLKKIMEREKIPGTIRIWPGVAEELIGTKAYYVRAGLFKDVDVALFTHVGRDLGVSWGAGGGTGLVSVLYSFLGESAHAAGAPWRGRSALDAVELMDVGWNFRREHLPLSSRSHYVIPDGGDQPNVVPPTASVWYYFRQTTYQGIRDMWAAGDQVAQGAAIMANVKLLPTRVLGSAWPQHFNRAIAEATYANIQKVGMPQWSEDDQAFARAVQKEIGVNQSGLPTRVGNLGGPVDVASNTGGGSDDIGDVSWNVPTVTLRYPSNIPGLPGHNWADGMAMATPIAHKGVTAGAKVQAMTLVDLLLKPEVITAAWTYFRDVQTATQKYEPLIRPQDTPAIELNREIMAKYRDRMKPLYFDPTKYKTYLEQLGIKYPVIKKQ